MVKSATVMSAVLLVLVSGCAIQKPAEPVLHDFYVEDFSSDAPKQCKASDVELSNADVKAYFERAKAVSHATIHDHYNVAPCRIEGTLKKGSSICDWKIDALGVGQITCNEQTKYYVCETCDDLFE